MHAWLIIVCRVLRFRLGVAFLEHCLVFTEERKVISQLLELLRSGALASLIPAVALYDQAPHVRKPLKNLNFENGAAYFAIRSSSWKLLKSTKRQALETTYKLIANGWSVLVKHFLAEMKSSAIETCLVSTAKL